MTGGQHITYPAVSLVARRLPGVVWRRRRVAEVQGAVVARLRALRVRETAQDERGGGNRRHVPSEHGRGDQREPRTQERHACYEQVYWTLRSSATIRSRSRA